MFKVTNKDNRRHSGVFIVNFKHISHFALVFLLLNLSKCRLGRPLKHIRNPGIFCCFKGVLTF